MKTFFKRFAITALIVGLWSAADNVDKLPNPVLDFLGYGILLSVIAVLVYFMFKIAFTKGE